jgi:BolA protein
MDNSKRMEEIRQLLTSALNPENLEVIDESHKHAGHAGAKSGKGHFVVNIISSCFEGKSLIEKHRMVYDALGNMMETDIHALSIKADVP